MVINNLQLGLDLIYGICVSVYSNSPCFFCQIQEIKALL